MCFFITIVLETMATLLVILLSFSLANGFDYYKRCLLFNKTCVAHCPKLMHPYHTRCDRDAISQRTCENAMIYPIGFTCGWSRCDCNGDLLLDEESYHCVPQDSCPIIRHKKPDHLRVRKIKRKNRKLPRISVPEDVDLIDMTGK